MLSWWSGFAERPRVAHLLRTFERFTVRGGAQLAAAIAYFSVLSLAPILMLAFSALGLTITVVMPQYLSAIEAWIEAQLNVDSGLGAGIYDLILRSLNNWASIGLIGLGITVWVGSGWVGNLKRAVRLLMRSEVDKPGKLLPLPLDVLANFAGLVGVLVGVAATFAASAVATSLGGIVGSWLGLGDSTGWNLLLRLVGFAVSMLIGAIMFRMLFGWFAPHPVSSHLAWVGAALGAGGLLVLQAITGMLIGAFSRNLGFAIFGSTLILMLFLNLFATLILVIACWLATAGPIAEPAPAEPVAELEPEPSPKPGSEVVSASVARRTLGIGLGTGYAVGTATGLGLGALVTALFARLWRR